MNPEPPDTGPAAARTGIRNRIQPTTEAILGSPIPVGTPAKAARVPAKWARHYAQLLNLRELVETGRHHLAWAAQQPLETCSASIADRATDEFDHEIALCQLSHEQDALYEIDQALKRIENGTYGICELSRKPIPEARLSALPCTRYVTEVERQLERENAVRRVHLGELRSVTGPIFSKVKTKPAEQLGLCQPRNPQNRDVSKCRVKAPNRCAPPLPRLRRINLRSSCLQKPI